MNTVFWSIFEADGLLQYHCSSDRQEVVEHKSMSKTIPLDSEGREAAEKSWRNEIDLYGSLMIEVTTFAIGTENVLNDIQDACDQLSELEGKLKAYHLQHGETYKADGVADRVNRMYMRLYELSEQFEDKTNDILNKEEVLA